MTRARASLVSSTHDRIDPSLLCCLRSAAREFAREDHEAGTLDEHRACRTGAVAFDVSHLGTLRVEGEGAFAGLQRALTNDLRKIEPGRAQYTHLLDADDASVLDDIIVWWVDEHRFDVMPNASNTARVEAALDAADGIEAVDVTTSRAVIAVQGPQAKEQCGNDRDGMTDS